MNILSSKQPRPSIEMRMPAVIKTPVNATLANGLPWWVLKMVGVEARRRLLQRLDAEGDIRI